MCDGMIMMLSMNLPLVGMLSYDPWAIIR